MCHGRVTYLLVDPIFGPKVCSGELYFQAPRLHFSFAISLGRGTHFGIACLYVYLRRDHCWERSGVGTLSVFVICGFFWQSVVMAIHDILTKMSVMQEYQTKNMHDDVIKWKRYPRNWAFVRWIHRSPMDSPHKGRWRGALIFSLTCTWTNGWANNRDAGEFTRHRAHYDVIIMNYRYWQNYNDYAITQGFRNQQRLLNQHWEGINA